MYEADAAAPTLWAMPCLNYHRVAAHVPCWHCHSAALVKHRLQGNQIQTVAPITALLPLPLLPLQALLQLCRFRNSHPAFQGRIFIDDTTPPHQLHIRWYSGTQHMAVLWADLASKDFSISHTPYPADTPEEQDDLASSTSSPYSLDTASIFSIDALDEDQRAAKRRQMVQAAQRELATWKTKGASSSTGGGASSGIASTAKGAGSSSNGSDSLSNGAGEAGDNARVSFVGGAAEAEELFNEMLQCADSTEFLEARKQARKMTSAEGLKPGGAEAHRTGQMVESLNPRGGDRHDRAARSNSSSSADGDAGSQAGNGNGKEVGSTRRSRRRKHATAAVAAAGQTTDAPAWRGVSLLATDDSPSEDSSSETGEEEEPAAAGAAAGTDPGAAGTGDAAVDDAAEGDGDGLAAFEHQLQQLDLAWGWQLPDKPVDRPPTAEAAAAG